MVRAWAAQSGAIRFVSSGLRTSHERSAELRRDSAEIERSSNAGTIHYPAGGNDWQSGFSLQQPSQCESAECVIM